MKRDLRQKFGFTLIELMIVVAIIGILAAVAIPSFLRFVNKSKTNEAVINGRAIINGAIAWYNEEHTDTTGNPMEQHFPHSLSPSELPLPGPTGSLSSQPSSAPCGADSAGALYIKNSQRWNSYPWLALKFSINKAHYYQYYYAAVIEDATYDAAASVYILGDLDCDGTFSTYHIKAEGSRYTNREMAILEFIITDALE